MNLYGLIGYPLGHSFSKKYFTEKFQRENLNDHSYQLFPLASIQEFSHLIKSNQSLRGLNVTIPYKQQVLEYVTEKTEAAKMIGAANTLKIKGEKIIAYNTDVVGFEKSFAKHLKTQHAKALVLGTGGSSKAVQFVLKTMGIEFLLVSRNEGEETNTINYSSIDKAIIEDYTIIINCTPVGMSPNDHEFPLLPYSLITSKHYLFDLIYNPEKTLFLKNGEERGATIQNGYEMLVIQAEESWKIWNED